MSSFDNGCYGVCPNCQRTFSLGTGNSMSYAQALMARLVSEARIDIDVDKAHADPRLRLDVLFPGDRGHMFGVLETRNADGETVWLKAFSSLRGGIRFVHGWVPPNLSEADYADIVAPQERAIKDVSARWATTTDPLEKQALANKRASMSKSLWNEMKSRYRFHNFCGKSAGINELFGDRGAPGGVGECCAPKLLCYAAQQGLTPIGLCEFYWGPKEQYDGKSEGHFYPCCEQRCRPILGFILCGSTKPA